MHIVLQGVVLSVNGRQSATMLESDAGAMCPSEDNLRSVSCYGSLFHGKSNDSFERQDLTDTSSNVRISNGSSVALCLLGRHDAEQRIGPKSLRSVIAHVSSVFDVDIFATPGPFNASLKAAIRRQAGRSKVYFDTNEYLSFEQLVSVLAINATWPLLRGSEWGHCGNVNVDGISLCVPTAYLTAFTWKSCARLIRIVEESRLQAYDWIIFSRYNFEWIWKHPPLAFFDANHIWSMLTTFAGTYGTDAIGLPDQHLIFSRQHLALVSSFWESLACPVPEYVRRVQTSRNEYMLMTHFQVIQEACKPSVGLSLIGSIAEFPGDERPPAAVEYLRASPCHSCYLRIMPDMKSRGGAGSPLRSGAIVPMISAGFAESDFEGLVYCARSPSESQPISDARYAHNFCVEIGAVYRHDPSTRAKPNGYLYNISYLTRKHFGTLSLDVVCTRLMCEANRIALGFLGRNPYFEGYAVAYIHGIGKSRVPILDFVNIDIAYD